MSDDTVTCPHCGSESRDSEWCDVCGGELSDDAEAEMPWLEVGHALAFDLDGTQRMMRVVDVLDVYATRRILFARMCPEGEESQFFSDKEIAGEVSRKIALTNDAMKTGEFPLHDESWQLLMIEESTENRALEPDILKEGVEGLVHLPLTRMERGPRRYAEIYKAPPGLPLQDHLESLGRLLALEEAASLTFLLMNALERVHKAQLFHFQVCPWTLHLSRQDGERGLSADTPMSEMRVTFEGIRGFYDAEAPVESHPVILGFSPPEFFGRAPGPLDHRADIFGVGMLFYYLLSGSPPPTGALTGHVPCVPLRAFRFELAPGLQPFMDGCTAQDPSERFTDIEEAREALEHAMEVVRSRSIGSSDERPGEVSLFCAVDSHIGIGKGRRTPINQDSVFLAHDADAGLAMLSVGDGVSTASFGSGDIASAMLIEACSKAWSERRKHFPLFGENPPKPEPTSPNNKVVIATKPRAPGSDEQVTADNKAILDAPEINSAIALEETLDMDLREVVSAIDGAVSLDDIEGAIDEAIANTLDVDSIDVATDPEDDDDPEIDDLDDAIKNQLPQGRLSLVGQRAGAPSLKTEAARMLTDILRHSNANISAYINERFTPFTGPVHEVMGTTALTAVIHGDHITLGSLGDSRAYLLRDGQMECLTRDHNLATMRIIEGFPADECLSLPQGTALARCLGTFEIHKGMLDATHPEPDLMTFRLLPGDTLLLTTDGLIDFAGPNEAASERNIKTILEGEEIPSLACLRLVLLANEGGGEDNIGVAVVRVTERHPGQRGTTLMSFPPVEALRKPN